MTRDDWFGAPPGRWSSAPLGHYSDVTLGKMLNASKDSSEGSPAPYLAAGSIQPEHLILDETKTMTFSKKELVQYELRKHDVVVVEGGAGYGRSHLLRHDLPGWGFQNHVARLRGKGSIAPGFLLYCLKACLASGYIEANNRTATLPSLSREVLRSIPLPLPPLEAQRTIANYLDRETARIDVLVEEQQRLIEMLRERRTAVIAHSTSQGTDIEFRRVITTIRQGWSPNCDGWPADGLEEWGVLKVGCANTGRFDRSENKRLPDEETPRPEFAVRRGELVMSRSNTKDLVGAAAVVDGDYPRLLLSDLTYGISLTADADPAFVAYSLASTGMRVQIGAASKGMSQSMQKISQRDIRELRIQMPALDEQRRVTAYLDEQTAKIDALITATKRFIELARERRATLITAAVTGQIDVREAA